MAQQRNKNSKSFIPSTASPTHGRRGCLCKNGKTYSTECCDGSVEAQGIGKTRLSEYFRAVITTGQSQATWGYRGYDGGVFNLPKYGSISGEFGQNKKYKIAELSMEIYPQRRLALVFDTQSFPKMNELIINGKSFLFSDGFVQTNRNDDRSGIFWYFSYDDYPFENETGLDLEIKGI